MRLFLGDRVTVIVYTCSCWMRRLISMIKQCPMTVYYCWNSRNLVQSLIYIASEWEEWCVNGNIYQHLSHLLLETESFTFFIANSKSPLANFSIPTSKLFMKSLSFWVNPISLNISYPSLYYRIFRVITLLVDLIVLNLDSVGFSTMLQSNLSNV